jgi:hypothetical protein
MMSSRERVTLALNHREPDRVPLDLGSTTVTGMHVTTIYQLRQALGLDKPGTPVKLMDPFQMLGETNPDLIDALGIDFVGLTRCRNRFGIKNDGWKPWTLFDGTPLLVPGEFNTEPEPNGDILQYPQGDRSVPASARMPKDGFYFDAVIRQPPIDDSKLNVEDNLEEFGPISEEELESLKQDTEQLYHDTDKAIVAPAAGTSFGDIGVIPGMELKHPKGIRDIEEWYMSIATRRDYIYRLFDRQCEIGLANLEKLHRAVGSRVAVLRVTGTDFGQQRGPFVSPQTYRDLFKPFHKRVNDWVHQHTNWKTFIHSCGSIRALLEDFIDAGFDILNPVQCSAAGMDPVELKKDFGDRIVFWGGGVDTQRTLPFGTPVEVRREVRERIKALATAGGFIFNPVHNVQARTPVENLLAMFETVREYGQYPVR